MSIFERKIVTLLTLGRAMFIDKFKKKWDKLFQNIFSYVHRNYSKLSHFH